MTNGGKQASTTLSRHFWIRVTVLLPAPYWTYPESIQLAGGFRPSCRRTWPVISPPSSSLRRPPPTRRKHLVFVSPSNHRAVYPPEQVAGDRPWGSGAWHLVVTDEIYEHLVYGDARSPRCPSWCGTGRPLRRRQRRRQDVRHDRLAVGWLIAPPDITKGGDELCSPTPRPTWRTSRRRPHWRPYQAT